MVFITILDSHQDELGDKYCSKYGLPRWIMDKLKITNSEYKFHGHFLEIVQQDMGRNLLSYDYHMDFKIYMIILMEYKMILYILEKEFRNVER